jgi:predicted acyl esterase
VWEDGSSHTIAVGALKASHRALDASRSAVLPNGDVVRPWHPHDAVEPLEPGEIVEMWIELWPMANVFDTDHRIRLSVMQGEAVWNADAGRSPALIYHDAQHPSYLVLPEGIQTGSQP